ncbi:MAG TPA: hypothetical protein VFW83_05130 [Bryobacteraceae bacterium]|nr:hypothetical protein [Bryobacteraceae bacterium]
MCICALAGLVSPSARGQEASEYVSYSWDEPTGDVYVYSEASGDYSTSYYYSICTTNAVWWNGSSAYNNYPVCGITDVQQELYANVGDSGWISPTGYFVMTMDYYASQFDPECGCDGYYWDAYNAEFLDGQTYDYAETWYLPGPPGTPLPEEQFTSTVDLYVSDCDFTISPGSISSNYCHDPTLQDQIFQANVSPNLTQCLPVSGDCSAGNPSGDISMGSPSQTCHIEDYAITADAYYYGPSSGNTGHIDLGFSLSLASTNHSHTQTTEVTCQ